MYVRVTSIKGDPSKLEQGIANFKERVVPRARSAPGYAGAAFIADREAGTAWTITYWESLQALNQAEELAQQLRLQSTQATGVEIVDVDRFEITLTERTSEPQLPGFVRINQIYADPSKADELIRYSRDVVVPATKSQPGFRALLSGTNRMTGRGFLSTVWATPEDRASSETAAVELRSGAAAIAGAEMRVQFGETLFVELKQPAVV